MPTRDLTTTDWLHANEGPREKSAKLPVIARDAGQVILKCPKSEPAQVATSQLHTSFCTFKGEQKCQRYLRDAEPSCPMYHLYGEGFHDRNS
eukprot:6185615-Pleurochrysis_carterae.AAC.1